MPLDTSLLDRLETCLQEQRLPWLPYRRPGLTPDQIAAMTEPLGITLAPELVLWWGWFNGTTGPQRVEITPTWEIASLEVAISSRASMREVAAEVALNEGDPVEPFVESQWPSSFLMFLGGGGSFNVAVDTRHPRSASLHYVEYHPNDQDLMMLAPSLGDAVHRWVEMYEAGYYRWDRDAQTWVEDGRDQQRRTPEAPPPGSWWWSDVTATLL